MSSIYQQTNWVQPKLQPVRPSPNMEKLTAERDAWKNASLAKDKLLTAISHDLKGQLSGLQGLINLISMEKTEKMPNSSYPYIDMLHESSSKMLLLLENLLQWSRLQTWKIKPQFKQLALSTVLKEIYEINQVAAESKKIHLIVDCDEKLQAHTDYYLLGFIVRNLVANALKYTPSEGEVRIAAKRVNREYIQIEVIDNGLGIPEETLQKLFDQQEIISSVGTAREKGTGLGLMLCLEFAQLLGSSLHIHSELGAGTSTSFFIEYTQ